MVEDKLELRKLLSILGSAADLLWPHYLPFLCLIIPVKRVTQIIIAQIPFSLSLRACSHLPAATSRGTSLSHQGTSVPCMPDPKGIGRLDLVALSFSYIERNLKKKHSCISK